MKKKWRKAVAAAMAAVLMVVIVPPGSYQTPGAEAASVTELTESRVDELYSRYFENKMYNRVSVHDPSIVVGYYEGTYTSKSPVYGEQNAAATRKEIYFVFGSHMAWAYSLDLKNWKSFGNNINNDYARIFESQANWSKRGDSVYNLGGNLWAPDVFWDAAYDNGDGTKGAWLMYMSINGCSWNSSISLLKSTTLNGDWTYVDTIIYSGFTESGTYDYTATNYKAVTGETSLPDRFKRSAYTCKDGETACTATTWQRSYGAHAIDPCIIEDGDKLWMTYGSWSGGIWMIEMDKATGLRKADFRPDYKENVSDPYMGYMLAGGSGVSGEASYIQRIGDKYYLFLSYGGLVAAGGYNMRVFAADAVTGPYKDLQGNDARRAKTSNAGLTAGTVGNRLMGYYKWDFMENGFTAEGHNSAFVDNDGKAYVIYHTRFDDGSEGHQLRVHQLFQAGNGGLVTAPFEYCGETLAETAYPQDDVTGEYRIVKMQSSDSDHANLNCATEQTIQLNADGTVTGAYAGTWNQSSDGPYVTLTSGGITYQGVFLKQNMEETAYETMCLTLVGNNDISLWGYQPFAGEAAVTRIAKKMKVSIGAMTYTDLTLPTDAMKGVDVTWSSSHPDIIASDGTVTAPGQNTDVTLTVTIQSGGASYSKDYKTTVLADLEAADTETGLKALYNFNDGMANVKNTSQTGELLAQSKGKKPERIYNAERGSKVLHQDFGYTAASDGTQVLTTSYAKYPNPLQGETLSGATISLWVNCVGQVDVWDTIWSFFDEDATDGIDGRLYLTPNMYLGYNGTGGWFDLNHADTPTNAMDKDIWKLVTVTIKDNDIGIYIDGTLTYTFDQRKAYAQSDGCDRTYPLKLISSAASFYTGYGSWWGSAPLYMDNIRIYNRALSELDVMKLYNQDLLEVQEDLETNHVDTSGYYYYNDYNTADKASAAWDTVTLTDYMSLETDTTGDYKTYVKIGHDGGSGNRSAYSPFKEIQTLPDNYTIEFDANLKLGNNVANMANQLALATGTYGKKNVLLDSGYVWSVQLSNSEKEWTLKGGADADETVALPAQKWLHFKTEISQSAKTAKLLITGNNFSYEKTISGLSETQPKGIYWLSGRAAGSGCFDNVRIYAYEVNFDANGGTGMMPNQAFKADTAARLAKNVFERQGYIFGGWAISPEGDVVYADQKNVSNLSANGGTVTLYAKWLDPSVIPLPTETPDPTGEPTAEPTVAPTSVSTEKPSAEPTVTPTTVPTKEPTAAPTEEPTEEPTTAPTEEPSKKPTPTPEAPDYQKPSVSPSVSPDRGSNLAVVKVGQICKKSKEYYQITSITAGKETMTLIRAISKSIKSLTIASAKVIGSRNFKITAIREKAFANSKKLKKIVIGKNIRSIGAKAFYKCKNLKKITIKSKKTIKIGKNAFKGINKKAVIKVPASKVKKYRKLLRKKGLSSKAKIVKI